MYGPRTWFESSIEVKEESLDCTDRCDPRHAELVGKDPYVSSGPLVQDLSGFG